MIGQQVYVAYAYMAGEIIGIEYPHPDEPHTPLFEIELADGRICYATQQQLS